MTTYYVQTVAPITDSSDVVAPVWGAQISGGDGSLATPYGSIQELIADTVLATGDTIYLDTETSGYPHYGPATITGVSGVTITRWPGTTIARMVNGYPLDLSTVHATGGTYDVYRTATGALASVPNSISQNWNTNINAQGHRYGILTAQASAAACASTYGYFYDSATDTLYVSIPSGANIADYEHIVGQAGHTLLIEDCPSTTVTYISAEHALSTTGTEGYGIRFDGASPACIARYCETDGCRWHSIGSVADDPTGTKLLNNICRTAIAGNDSHLVIYAGATGGKIDACEMSNNTLYLVPWLGHDGNAIGSVAGVIGIVSHTASTASDATVGGLIIRGNTTIWEGHNPTAYSPDCMFVAANAKLGGQPTDINDPDTYPVQLIGNTWGGHGMQIGAGTSNEAWVASVRDRWYLDTETVSASTGSGGYISCNGGTSTDVGLLLVSCTISGDTVKTTSHKALVSLWTNGGKVYMEGCTLHMRGTGHNSGARILAFASSATGFSANGCVFSAEQASGMRFATGQWSGALPDTAAENAAFNDNWYGPNLLATFNSTTGDTRTTFESTTDPTGEYTASPEYESDTTLEPTATMRETVTTKASGPEGINNRLFSDQYGAWQYGASTLITPGGTRTRARSRVRGAVAVRGGMGAGSR